MEDNKSKTTTNKALRSIIEVMNIFVLIGCIVILVTLSLQILYPEQYGHSELFLKIITGICIIFLFDFMLKLIISKNRIHYFFKNFVFLIISIPYLYIIEKWQIHISDTVYYTLHLIIFIRGGYGLVVVISWISKSLVNSLFYSYLIILPAVTYFSSLLFYSVEGKVNMQVTNYWDALWWASMNVTTVGSNIVPQTEIGRGLSVTLAIMGMCMFPILTTFISVTVKNKKDESENSSEQEKR